MMDVLDVVGYVLAALTVVVVSVTLAGPVVHQQVRLLRPRKDLKTIDGTVAEWARDSRRR